MWILIITLQAFRLYLLSLLKAFLSCHCLKETLCNLIMSVVLGQKVPQI